jgi:formylglycine-generating enzyme required for sulfatase activity
MLAKRPEDRQESMTRVIRELETCRGSGEAFQETASISLGSTGGDPTLPHVPLVPEMTVSPAPPPIHPDSGNLLDGNWLKEELPESPTLFRPVPPAAKKPKNRLMLIGSIAAAVLVLIVILGTVLTGGSHEAPVATRDNKLSVNDPANTAQVAVEPMSTQIDSERAIASLTGNQLQWLGYNIADSPDSSIAMIEDHANLVVDEYWFRADENADSLVLAAEAANMKVVLALSDADWNLKTNEGYEKLSTLGYELIREHPNTVHAVCAILGLGMDGNDIEQLGRDLERDFPDLEYWVMCVFTGDPKNASLPIEVDVVLLDVCGHGESQKLSDALEKHLPRWTADPSQKYVLHWSSWLHQSPGLVPTCDKEVVHISHHAAKKHGLSGLVFASLGGDSHDPTRYKLDGFQTRPELMDEVRAIGRELGIRTGSVSALPRRDQISLGNTQVKERPFIAPSKPSKDTPSLAIPPFEAAQAKQHQQTWADYLGVPVESENSIGMKMVLIPPGEFLMGSSEEEQARFLDEARADNDHWAIERIPNEGPRHQVRITRPFRLSRHEVTLGQFRLFVEEAGYETDAERNGKGGWGGDGTWGKWVQNPRFVWNLDPGFEQTDEHPVVNISWNDATAFCKWLSKKTGDAYVLPTEAQWEYACRAGTTTAWHSGDGDDLLGEYAWFIASAGGKTHRVGQLKPNGWNLYGMHANVREWCADRWGPDYYRYVQSRPNDPTGPTTGSHRVFRGGHWLDYAACCRSAYRDHYSPVICGYHLGFRPAQEIPTGRPASDMSPR